MRRNRKGIVRDPKGRELEVWEEEDAFEPSGVLRDGYSLRIPLYMKDGTPVDDGFSRAIVDSYKRRRSDDTLVITTSAPPMIVDGSGGIEGLNRPGARYLVAGHRTTEHARLVTAAHMREEAYRAYDRAAAEQYKHPSERGTDGDLMCEPERQTDAMPMTGDVATMERAHAERMQALYDEADRLDAERWMTAR